MSEQESKPEFAGQVITDSPPTGIIAERYSGAGRQSFARKRLLSRCGAPVRMRVVVDEPPYQVNKAALVEKVAAMVKERKPEGISDMRDESDRQGMRAAFDLRANVRPRIVLNSLYKFAAMQKSFSANMLALGGRDASRSGISSISGAR